MKAIKARALGACESLGHVAVGMQADAGSSIQGIIQRGFGPWMAPSLQILGLDILPRGGPVQAGTKRARRAASLGR